MIKKIICLTCSSAAICYGATTLAAPTQSNHYYAVQVAAGFSHAAAEKSLHVLPQHNLSKSEALRVVEVKETNKPATYKVVFGNFANYAQAKKSLGKQSIAKDAYIVRIDNANTNSTPTQTNPIQTKNVKSSTKTSSKETKNSAINQKKSSNQSQQSKKVASKEVKQAPKIKTDKKTARSPTSIREGIYPAATFKISEGSLKHNIQRFAKQFKYKLIWKVTDTSSGLPADYTWLGHETLEGDNATSILHRIVSPYKIETQVWQKNRVVCISNTHSCNK